MRVFFCLLFSVFCLFLLVACGGEATPVSQAQLTAIPTFTVAAASSAPGGTATPTAIVVPPTATLAPTLTVAPMLLTATPTLPPTSTASPTVPPRPTLAGASREITSEQARNLNGYRALLPTYLPPGFKLVRITASETTNPRIITVVSEYEDAQGRSFFINAQAVPSATPTPTRQPTPTAVAAPVSPGSTLVPTVTPTYTPRPTAASLLIRQENIGVRNQQALLSYNNSQASLSWSEGVTRYFLNGELSRDSIIKVAESLS